MDLWYSNLPPLKMKNSGSDFIESFSRELSKCDEVDIAVGYVSQPSLTEINRLIREFHVRICLILGMYFVEGISEKTYRKTRQLNSQWMAEGLGEVRMVKSFKYHGKVYLFKKSGKPVAAVLGSANLSAIKPDAPTLRQYEVAVRFDDVTTLKECLAFINKLKQPPISFNINEDQNVKIVRENNSSLKDMAEISDVSMRDLGLYEKHAVGTRFLLPLKVPYFKDRFIDDKRHYTQSNLNTCYASPRSKRKLRSWYEVQFTVSNSINKLPGYPQKGKPFLVITDDGHSFKVHTTSANNKQFNAVGNEQLLGRWLKGRLEAAGLVEPVQDIATDTSRSGMITREMLNEYGCHSLYLQKTDKIAEDENGNELEVWLLGFAYDRDLSEAERQMLAKQDILNLNEAEEAQ